ncbi:hypothetical protein FOWG_09772 [Fusarium oxysporum f. sp. lycopersici MN25]|uniref:Uncharacterized protein n=1 Tax=Fusarium oxysporum Fo47 TaxID=660027 RepID=W9KAB2_FUSOX|nr:hypothetical protein FOZG_08688 [Fusarium oxysporum Fo47]EWZ88240.1 hypothetical protein FOWG_09772 [Fusarium oxysporum f. sp. lycopersici MN25]
MLTLTVTQFFVYSFFDHDSPSKNDRNCLDSSCWLLNKVPMNAYVTNQPAGVSLTLRGTNSSLLFSRLCPYPGLDSVEGLGYDNAGPWISGLGRTFCGPFSLFTRFGWFSSFTSSSIRSSQDLTIQHGSHPFSATRSLAVSSPLIINIASGAHLKRSIELCTGFQPNGC